MQSFLPFFHAPCVLLLAIKVWPTLYPHVHTFLWELIACSYYLLYSCRLYQVWKERIIVVVSHDRAFLDEVCSDVLHISGAARRLTQSHGNYTLWATRRAEQQAVYAKEAMLRSKEVDRMKEFAGEENCRQSHLLYANMRACYNTMHETFDRFLSSWCNEECSNT
jgi:hypothetical protein